jgi:hypothetical protein
VEADLRQRDGADGSAVDHAAARSELGHHLGGERVRAALRPAYSQRPGRWQFFSFGVVPFPLETYLQVQTNAQYREVWDSRCVRACAALSAAHG